MLDPDVKLGTSTPKADPSGDYAFEVFAKAEALQARRQRRAGEEGAAAHRRADERRRRPQAAASMAGMSPRAGPTSSSPTAPTRSWRRSENPGQQIVALPDTLAVGADYGLTVMNGASPEAVALRHVHPVGAKDSIFCAKPRISRRRTAARRITMKISARNQLKGKIVEVKKGATTAHVKIDIGGADRHRGDHQRSGGRAEARRGQDGLCGHQGERRDGRRSIEHAALDRRCAVVAGALSAALARAAAGARAQTVTDAAGRAVPIPDEGHARVSGRTAGRDPALHAGARSAARLAARQPRRRNASSCCRISARGRRSAASPAAATPPISKSCWRSSPISSSTSARPAPTFVSLADARAGADRHSLRAARRPLRRDRRRPIARSAN